MRQVKAQKILKKTVSTDVLSLRKKPGIVKADDPSGKFNTAGQWPEGILARA
jgi:hypothetical protein